MRFRQGLSLLEILVALAILGVAAGPIVGMLRGARSRLGQSQEALRMQLMAQRLFEEARLRLVRGEFSGLGSAKEEEVFLGQDELAGRVTVQRDPGTRGFVLAVEVVSSSRCFTFRAFVADTSASYMVAPRSSGGGGS